MKEYLVFGGCTLYLFLGDLWLNRGKEMTLTRAASWSIMYVLAALMFSVYIYGTRGVGDAQLFLTAYVLEKVLSIDNLMVFSAVFAYYGIRPQHRHRILHWGILGAAAMRLVFVYAGTGLLEKYEMWTSLGFAILIAIASIKIMKGVTEEPIDHKNRWYVKWLDKVRPLYTGPGSDAHFLVKSFTHDSPSLGASYLEVITFIQSKPYWCFTPALLCLISIEITDVIFAVDSVPVVIAVARDPFIVYSAMIFAIMGLRAMYFILEALQRMLRFMNVAVGAVLMFISVKLLLSALTGIHVPPTWSLAAIGVMLGMGIASSLIWKEKRA